MAEIPDLSKLNGSSPDPDEQKVFRTGFMVLVDAQGNIQVTADLGENVIVEHPPTHDEIWSAASLICKDIQVQQTAGLVQTSLLQMGSMMQQAQVDTQLRQRLNLK
jgi:hypothetical protein